MLKEAIYHRPKNQFAYIYQNKNLHIQLKAKKDDLEKAMIIFGDPYDWKDGEWKFALKEMNKSGSDELFDYWTVSIQPPFRRVRYGFELYSQTEKHIYTEKGFLTNIPSHDLSYFFCFSYLHSIDEFQAPAWVKETIWYQIFPERFANGNKNNDPEGTLEWGSSEPTSTNRFGGDLEGIIHHLDYLKELGINGIYLTPIFHAFSNHKYDTIDYMEIDPQFGDKQTFRKLVQEAHSRGIKIMLDAVFNHCGFYFPPFQDVLRHNEKSPYKDWFHIREFPVKTKPTPTYETFSFTEQMPKLNTSHPDVKKYLLEVGQYWVREFDIDGWRLDVANEVDHQFWREFRHAVKSIKNDVYILGEIWHDSMPWLQGDQFDAVMNYRFTTAVLDYFLESKMNAAQFSHTLQQLLHSYPKNVNEFAFNLLGSHDTSRIMNMAQFHKEKIKLLFVFLLTFIGSPCIYYGDEIGIDGENDPGSRKCMIWDPEKQDRELFNHVKQLISLRKTFPVLANSGEFTLIEVNENSNHLIYSRRTNNQHVFIFINPREQLLDLRLPASVKDKKLVDLWTKEEFAAHSDEVMVKLNPFSFKILMIEED